MPDESGYHVAREFSSDEELGAAYCDNVISAASDLVQSAAYGSEFFISIHHLGGSETRTRMSVRGGDRGRHAAASRAMAGTLLTAVGRICQDAGVEFTWEKIADLLSKDL